MTRLVTALLAATFILNGCDGEPPLAAAPRDVTWLGPIVADQIEEELTAAICVRAVRCRQVPVDDAQACVDIVATFGGERSSFGTPRALEDAVLARRVELDGRAARVCVEALRELDCGASRSEVERVLDCQRGFIGRVADGGRCTTDAACGADSFCERSAGGDSCAGRCVPRGVRCRTDLDCGFGDVCSSGECTKTQSPPGEIGEACNDYGQCAIGLACRFKGNGAICLPPPGLREACAMDGRCADGLRCARSRTLPMGVCLGSAFELGDPCDADDLASCGSFLACVPGSDGAARCMLPRTLGQSCRLLHECGGVTSTLYCDAETKTCLEKPTTGACVAGDFYGCDPRASYCDVFDGATCRPYKATGERCQDAAECGPSYLHPRCAAGGDGGSAVCQALVQELCLP